MNNQTTLYLKPRDISEIPSDREHLKNHAPDPDKPDIFRDFNIKKGGLNLCVGSSIGSNAVAAVRLAYELQRAKVHGDVLLVNTYQSRWKIDEAFKAAVHDRYTENTQEDLFVMHSTIGELPHERQTMLAYASQSYLPCKVIVINSWEFAAGDSRSREKLLFTLQNLITHFGVTVIVFAEALQKQATPGKIMRGGFGKLTAITDRVFDVKPEHHAAIEAEHETLLEREMLKAKPREVANSEDSLNEVLKASGIVREESVCVHSDMLTDQSLAGEELEIANAESNDDNNPYLQFSTTPYPLNATP